MTKRTSSNSPKTSTPALSKPGETEEHNTESSGAHTSSRNVGGRPKGPAALFSKADIERLEDLAQRLEDPLELVDWAKRQSLVWLVTLNELVHKGRGPSGIGQTAGVIEKLIKYTGEIMEVPRDHTVIQKATPEQDGQQGGADGPGDDSEIIAALQGEPFELPSGK
jgi:hypothetical protein